MTILNELYLCGFLVLATLGGLNWLERQQERSRTARRANFHRQEAELRAAMLAYLQARLANPQSPAVPGWATVLGLSLPVDKQQVQQAFRELSKQHHPDKGGSVALMQQLVEARTQALNWVQTAAPA